MRSPGVMAPWKPPPGDFKDAMRGLIDEWRKGGLKADECADELETVLNMARDGDYDLDCGCPYCGS